MEPREQKARTPNMRLTVKRAEISVFSVAVDIDASLIRSNT